jgi:hypothetical protein
MPPVSLIATLAATVASFVLGALWYGPLFGKSWMKENGFTEEDLRKDFNPGKTYGLTFLISFAAAYVFGAVLGPDPARPFAVGAGFAAGLFWVAGSMATNYLFERKTAKLLAINATYHTVQFTLYGAAFGLLG